jgi:hypothetical protein
MKPFLRNTTEQTYNFELKFINKWLYKFFYSKYEIRIFRRHYIYVKLKNKFN